MNPRVTEFQCIMPLENVPSVLKLGILSNERAAKRSALFRRTGGNPGTARFEACPRRLETASIREFVFSRPQPDDV
jgi:hypothetical protein